MLANNFDFDISVYRIYSDFVQAEDCFRTGKTGFSTCLVKLDIHVFCINPDLDASRRLCLQTGMTEFSACLV